MSAGRLCSGETLLFVYQENSEAASADRRPANVYEEILP